MTMAAIMEAFKIKPFDLEPIYASWSSPPIFQGEPKIDPPVSTWLDEIKAGCVERKVPKEYWPKVAQHNLGPKAQERVHELKVVMAKVHGGKYRWNWKRFKVAMKNMGWDIDPKKTEGIKVATKPSGSWWVIGREKDASQTSPHSPVSDKSSESNTLVLKPLPPTPKTGEKKPPLSCSPPRPPRNPTRRSSSTSQVVSPIDTPGGTETTVKQVPTWLLNACNALEFLSVEHPAAMTTLSAVLITIGSLPALPAIAGGAGGAFLASHAFQAAGAIAVGLGNWLKVAQETAQLQYQQKQQNLLPPGLNHAMIEDCTEK